MSAGELLELGEHVAEVFRNLVNYKKEVIITVDGGIAKIHTIPSGVKVKIVDFDVSGHEVDGKVEHPVQRFEGERAIILEYEGEEKAD